jgi:hypothetical protein
MTPYPGDAGDEVPTIVARDYTAFGGDAACMEVLRDGTERLVWCWHRNHATYTHYLTHHGKPCEIPPAFVRLDQSRRGAVS